MTSPRRQRRRLARWERTTRQWATRTAKELAVDLAKDDAPPISPYTLGVVLDPGEKPWAQFTARCSPDQLSAPAAASTLPLTDWLITSTRIVGRYTDEVLLGWRWEWIVGLVTDLTPGHEYVHLDSRKEGYPPRVTWTGPGVLPLAVAAVYHLYGVQALLNHPGLAPIRAATRKAAPEIQAHLYDLTTPPRPSNRGL